jgi:hypothetical protein
MLAQRRLTVKKKSRKSLNSKQNGMGVKLMLGII